MKRYGVHTAILEPGAFNFTQLFNTSWLDDDLEKIIVQLPQHLREEYGEAVLNESIIILYYNNIYKGHICICL